ncbi:hypothetical protein Aperf_G00000133119 [Anoplocephala perfoliata]
MSRPYLRLNSGYKIPQIGFGTFDAPKDVVGDAVKKAFDAGYLHIDCAALYGNEKEVGEAIAESMEKHGLKRKDIFITSKLWCDSHDPKDVRNACKDSLRKLGLDYLDLYLIHWPVSFHFKKGVPIDFNDPNCLVYEYHKLEDTWRAMEELVAFGHAKSIGVSNFNKHQIRHIVKHGTIVPAVNQVEVNLHWLNTRLIDYCRSKRIVIEGYSPFGSPGVAKSMNLLAEPILELKPVVEIAERHNVTPAQVIIRHGLQRNIVVLAKSVTAERIRSNFDVLDFKLSDEEMEQLNTAGRNKRLFEVLAYANHPEYPFSDEF